MQIKYTNILLLKATCHYLNTFHCIFLITNYKHIMIDKKS